MKGKLNNCISISDLLDDQTSNSSSAGNTYQWLTMTSLQKSARSQPAGDSNIESSTEDKLKFAWTRKDSRNKIKEVIIGNSRCPYAPIMAAKRTKLTMFSNIFQFKQRQSGVGPSKPIEQIQILPAELLLEVFSHLDYRTLNDSIPLTCRDFKSIVSRLSPTSSTLIDVALFRDYPIPRPLDEKYILHPLIAKLVQSGALDKDYTFSLLPGENEEAKLFAKTTDNHSFWSRIQIFNKMFAIEEVFLMFLSVWGRPKCIWKENVTSPAVRKLVLTPQRYGGRMVRGITITSKDGGITVFDVMLATVISLHWAEVIYRNSPGIEEAGQVKNLDEIQAAVWWMVGRSMHAMPKRASMFEPWVYMKKWIEDTGFINKVK